MFPGILKIPSSFRAAAHNTTAHVIALRYRASNTAKCSLVNSNCPCSTSSRGWSGNKIALSHQRQPWSFWSAICDQSTLVLKINNSGSTVNNSRRFNFPWTKQVLEKLRWSSEGQSMLRHSASPGAVVQATACTQCSEAMTTTKPANCTGSQMNVQCSPLFSKNWQICRQNEIRDTQKTNGIAAGLFGQKEEKWEILLSDNHLSSTTWLLRDTDRKYLAGEERIKIADNTTN